MNKIETFVYQRVKNNYIVKNLLRNIYQGFFDVLPRQASWFSISPIVREGYFFGFHDLDPFSQNPDKLLANRLLIPLRMPTQTDSLEVGYLGGKQFSEWHPLGETLAWNYHKGCRLQWLDAGSVIYNVYEQSRLGARVVSLGGKLIRQLDWAIDTVAPNGRMATSFSYGRLQRNMPGYGYVFDDDDMMLEENAPASTGLFLIDLETGKRELLLDLQTIACFLHESSMDGKMHFVTHTEFSYDNRYVSFLHRWYKGTSRNTRLIVYDLHTHKMMASPTSGMVSHYAWNRKNGIVAYCRVENVDSHVYFSSPDMLHWKRCAYPRLNSDGHQHFVDNDWFLVDTYPDKWRHVKLYLVNVKSDEVRLLADVDSPKRFVSPSEQKHWKCDLHPRCSTDGKWACFDSVHTGLRSLCIMPLQI